MSQASSKLQRSAFVYSSIIDVEPLSFEPISLSPEFIYKPGKTPIIRKHNSLRVLSIPRTNIAGWHLKSVLLVQIHPRRKQTIAMTWLEGVAEYGIGRRDSEAITDLITSLGEYREALESRETNLGDEARNELNALRNIIERSQVS